MRSLVSSGGAPPAARILPSSGSRFFVRRLAIGVDGTGSGLPLQLDAWCYMRSDVARGAKVILPAVPVAAAPGTGGAPLWQLVLLGVVYWGGTGTIVWLILRHRAGQTRLLARPAQLAGWVFGLPGWSAL